MRRKCPQKDWRGERCTGTSPRKQVVAGLVVYLEGQRNVLKYSKENNRGRQADENPDPSLGRKCGKGGNKEACGYFQEKKSYFETLGKIPCCRKENNFWELYKWPRIKI